MPATSVSAGQPSFDCLWAAAPIGHSICSDLELLTLDGALGDAFASYRQRLPEKDRAGTLAEQRSWLARRTLSKVAGEPPARLGVVGLRVCSRWPGAVEVLAGDAFEIGGHCHVKLRLDADAHRSITLASRHSALRRTIEP